MGGGNLPSMWGDLLTAYDGTAITYDGIGNPLSDGTWTYTWRNGRELATMTSGNTTWTYTYDANGMRTSRTNGTKTYNYVYNGGQLTQMTVGNDTLYFTYGAIGPTTVTWNGTTYYYAVNGQGDVIGIFDGSGNCVVTYNWDNAWGYNPEPEGTMAATLGTLNPLRYRSYVYDEETDLYYLQSRYYNPEICRFINADAFVSTGQGLLGYNMFAYCRNNPVCRVDMSGAADKDCLDNDPLDEEDILKPGDGGGAATASGNQGNAMPSLVTTSGSTVPQHATNTLNYIRTNGEAPQGYRSGPYANDGRGGTKTLPPDAPYREYDVHPYMPGVNRGTERLVVGASGTAWYTPDHYISFIRME